jgi:hypothetical protein
MTTSDFEFLTAALEYAARGWLVFPVHTPVNGGCSCGDPTCDHVGKHPRTEHGFLDATRDVERIRDWWEKKYPSANIGIATGTASGIVVLDVDPRNGGEASLEELEKKIGPLPRTVAVLTGGGGMHFYFKAEEPLRCTTDALGPGLDFKADGGYVIAPPSVHPSGESYFWEASSEPA